MRIRNTVAKGFTLVEILIVVVILGILAAIVVPQFTNAANEARGGNVATQESTLQTQIELWAARHNGEYPDLVADGWDDLIDGGYLKSQPANPFAPAANRYTVTAFTFDDIDDATADAMSEDPAQGWLYDESNGIIRAARGLTVAEEP